MWVCYCPFLPAQPTNGNYESYMNRIVIVRWGVCYHKAGPTTTTGLIKVGLWLKQPVAPALPPKTVILITSGVYTVATTLISFPTLRFFLIPSLFLSPSLSVEVFLCQFLLHRITDLFLHYVHPLVSYVRHTWHTASLCSCMSFCKSSLNVFFFYIYLAFCSYSMVRFVLSVFRLLI